MSASKRFTDGCEISIWQFTPLIPNELVPVATGKAQLDYWGASSWCPAFSVSLYRRAVLGQLVKSHPIWQLCMATTRSIEAKFCLECLHDSIVVLPATSQLRSCAFSGTNVI